MSYTLVTGGAKNLGAEICLTLAKNQMNVVIHYNTSKTSAIEVAEKCRLFGVKAETINGDFSTLNGVKEFAKEYLRLFPDTKNIVNNVGNYLVKPLLDSTPEEIINLFQVNLHAPILLIQSLVPSIKFFKGSVINLGVAGIDKGRAESYSTAYSMTKLSLLMLTRSLAKELAPFNVAVNMVSPGILEGSIDAPKNLEPIPMQRLGTYEQVADVVLFLLNQKNHYITGQNIEVAGGVRL